MEARKHFNCPYLDGAELEDEGGSGTAGSHWESRIFGVKSKLRFHCRNAFLGRSHGWHVRREYHRRSARALHPNSRAFTRQRMVQRELGHDRTFSIIDFPTLFFQGHLEWGKNAGCSFAMDSCEEYMTHFKNQSWFCTQSGVDGCTADLHAYGKCMTSILLNGCSIVQPYTNMDCKQSRNTASAL